VISTLESSFLANTSAEDYATVAWHAHRYCSSTLRSRDLVFLIQPTARRSRGMAMDQPTIAITDDALVFAELPPQEMKSKVILAVDDDSEMLAIIEGIGRRAGYTVFGARSGEECLAMLWRVMPQLIMLDVKMPGLDGFETCRRIRGDRKVTQVPVAFLTARRTVEDLKRSVAVGGDDFLIKPFNATQLIARIEHLISRGHLPAMRRARRSSKLNTPVDAQFASTVRDSEPHAKGRSIRMVAGVTGHGAKSIDIPTEAKPNPHAANAMAAKVERGSLRQIAAQPLTPFLAPENIRNAPGLISTSVLPPWWDALMAIAHDQLATIQVDLDRLLSLDDAVGLDALARTLRGIVASSTARLVVMLENAKPSRSPAVEALAQTATVEEIRWIAEIFRVAGPLDDALAAFTRVLQCAASTASAGIADLTPRLVSEARKCYTGLGDDSVAGQLFVLAILNRLDKPWQVFRLIRAVLWKRGAAAVSRKDLVVVGDLLFFDLEGTALAVDNATAKLQTVPGPINVEHIIALVARYVDADEGLLSEADLRGDSSWDVALLRARARMCAALDGDRLQRIADAILAPVHDTASSGSTGDGDTRDAGTSRKTQSQIANAASSIQFLTYVAQRSDKQGFGGPARALLDALREEVARRIEIVLEQRRSTPDYLGRATQLVDILYNNDKRRHELGGRLTAALNG
jgi:CheY-like chemotaxis protein